MSEKRVLPPVYFLAALVAMAMLHFFLPLAHIIPSPWNRVGLAPLAAGITIAGIANVFFAKAHTTIKPFQISTSLVTGGPFRFSRNPMYVSMLLVLIGVALLFGSITPFPVTPALAIVLDRVFIRVEEQMLAETFDQQWVDYKGRVRRWL